MTRTLVEPRHLGAARLRWVMGLLGPSVRRAGSRPSFCLRWTDFRINMAKTYYLPTVAAIAVAPFTPIAPETDDPLTVEYLDYGVIGGLQITSLSYRPLTIEKVLVNDEFHPFLHALRGNGTFLCIGFPRCLLKYGDSFITVTHAAAAADHIRSLCYEKPIEQVQISTNLGDFAFEAGETLRERLTPHGRLD